MNNLVKGKYYITRPGGEKLHAELEELQAKRMQMAGNIRTAKAFGDLSENFEYHEAKREQGMVEGRIMQLKQILPQLEMVGPEEVDISTVGFGTVVRVLENTVDEVCYSIVGPLEADPMDDRISYESPLGEALWGRRLGETVTVQVPVGTISLEIVEIRRYEI